MNQTAIDRKITEFIFYKPEVVEKLLQDFKYKLSGKVTLNELIDKTYNALYTDQNKDFAKAMDDAIDSDGYKGFIVLAVTAALSIASSLMGSAQAKKQRQLQATIAMAQLETDKLLGEEKIRVYGEIERTRILANSLQEYRSNLQTEATKRQKNVYIYLIAIGLSISIIYGSITIFKPQ